MASEMDAHVEAYQRAYARFPNLPPERRAAWAERVANSIPLQLAYSLTGPVWPRPFAAEDYLNDEGSR